jgi:hypothetical protein
MADADLSPTVRFGLFEVNLRAGELRKNGVKIKLQEQPFRILVSLLRQPGDVVTRVELRRELWPSDTFVDFDHSLNAAVKRCAMLCTIPRKIHGSSKLCRDTGTVSSVQRCRTRFIENRPALL